MANGKNGNGSKKQLTVDQLLAQLKDESIKSVADNTVRDLMTQGKNLVKGIGNAYLEPDSEEQQLVAKQLGEVNVTVDDATGLVKDVLAVRDLLRDRDSKVAVAQAATAKLDTMRVRLHEQIQSYTGIIRSQLGTRSPALEGFGIKKLGGRGGGARKKKDGNGDSGSKDGKGQNGGGDSGSNGGTKS